MSSTMYRGVIEEGKVILQQPSIPLADGTEIRVTLVPAEPGTGKNCSFPHGSSRSRLPGAWTQA